MDTALASVMKQRGKTVLLFVVLGFVHSMAHPATASSVWQAMALAVAALASMEAYASTKSTGGQ